MNRKLLILLVVILGIATAGGIFWFVKGVTQKPTTEIGLKEQEVRELPLAARPFASMTPRTDGHEFKLSISKIPSGFDTLEYELVYKNSSGVTQGVPGSPVKLKGATTFERNLLLGSCSSGKCKYDEGVEKGTLTLRLRNADGELLAKLETGFHLQQGGPLSSSDGNFKFTSSALSAKTFYLTMGTFGLPAQAGLPGSALGEVTAGPYGVFTSGKTTVTGAVSLGTGTIYGWTGSKWAMLEGGKTSSLGVFVATSQ